MPKNSESKNGVEDEKQAIDLDAQMKIIENQIAELSGQYKFLQSMKEQGVELMAPKSSEVPAES
ncbi:MAG: hypothetical protein QF535_06775 [Anaerolineales bacterium]|jgi:uncharacterized protein involved in exopolysaccharide biosynthesis|nr:hypothetical protein [Anaerolineales bacterium]